MTTNIRIGTNFQIITEGDGPIPGDLDKLSRELRRSLNSAADVTLTRFLGCWKHWDEHPKHSVQDWINAVTDDETRLGYWEWVQTCLELEAEEAEAIQAENDRIENERVEQFYWHQEVMSQVAAMNGRG